MRSANLYFTLRYCIRMKCFYDKWLVLFATVFLLFGCSDKELSSRLIIKPNYNGKAIHCANEFIHEERTWSYTQLQFFISNVSLKMNDGSWTPWTMAVTDFQNSDVVLVGEVCDKYITDEKSNKNWRILFTKAIDLTQVSDIKFTLGVPFQLNHLNPLTQSSPLNVPSMFWVWQMGHKFLRLELTNENDDWLFHLGSTGCRAPSPMRAPKEECLQPNRVEIELPFSTSSRILFDLGALLKGVQLGNESSCQSALDDESCKVIMANVGVTGRQKTFKADVQSRH